VWWQVRRGVQRLRFRGSASYWERRYAANGTSGAGSYGVLADFKARVLNEFIRKNSIESVIEFGCGDGNQLRLADFPRYIGLDVAATAIDKCCQTFSDDPSKSFFLYDPQRFRDPLRVFTADLALSLDVVYHLVEDRTFEKYMADLFNASNRFVAIYSTNAEIPDAGVHVRHRHFTDWVEENVRGWTLVEVVPNDHPDVFGGWCDFHVYRRTAGT
jgi:hypothetical protein